MMKVRELIEILEKYDGDLEVVVDGGGDDFSDWSELKVGHFEKVRYINGFGIESYIDEFNGDVIMEMEEH